MPAFPPISTVSKFLARSPILGQGAKIDLKKSLYYLNINIALMTPVLSVGKGKKLVTDNLESVSLNHTRLHIFVMPFCMSGEV